MASKPMKRCSVRCYQGNANENISEKKKKISVRYQYILIRMAKILTAENTKYWQ